MGFTVRFEEVWWYVLVWYGVFKPVSNKARARHMPSPTDAIHGRVEGSKEWQKSTNRPRHHSTPRMPRNPTMVSVDVAPASLLCACVRLRLRLRLSVVYHVCLMSRAHGGAAGACLGHLLAIIQINY